MRELACLTSIFLSFFAIYTYPLKAVEIIVDTGNESVHSFYMGPEDSLVDMIDTIAFHFDEANSTASPCASTAFQRDIGAFRLELAVNKGKIIAKSAKNPDEPPRDYFNSLSQADRDDIGYIVVTLANNSLFKILGHKSSLESAGDRVEHVHPFKFLETIFTNEELKVGIRNIQNKGGWVWSDFLEGITDSLTKEAAVDNLKEEYVKDFAKNVKIDQKLISPSLKKRDWKKFVQVLIDNVPREGNPNRYDM